MNSPDELPNPDTNQGHVFLHGEGGILLCEPDCSKP
jgi:hypothetical protein